MSGLKSMPKGQMYLCSSALMKRAIGMAKEGVVSTSALEDAQKNYEMALNKQNVSKAQVIVLRRRLPRRKASWARTAPP